MYFSLFFQSKLVNCILDNIPYPMPRIMITFPNFIIFFSMLHGTLPSCRWLGTDDVLFPVLCFSYAVGLHSYDSSELFQYLKLFDTMCKKLLRFDIVTPVVR